MPRATIIVAAALTTGIFGYALVTLRASAERSPSESSEHTERSTAEQTSTRDRGARATSHNPNRQVAMLRWEPKAPTPTGIEPATSSPAATTAEDSAEVEAREVQRALEFYTQGHGQQSRDPS